MKEHPILFSALMVRALLARTKTQTRRTRKPRWVPGDRLWVREAHWMLGKWIKNGFRKNGKQAWKFILDPSRSVRFDAGSFPPKERTEIGFHKRSSMFMPRWASRLTLEVVRTWQEPLQEISEADAIAEGIQCFTTGGKTVGGADWIRQAYSVDGPPSEVFDFPSEAYADLWDSINGKNAPWESNPTVNATEFRVVANG